MFEPKDYYGNQYKWFVGKVKDVNDPLNSNRVRVHIFGVHPDEDLISGMGSTIESTTQENTNQGFNVTPPGSLSAVPPAVGAELTPVDRNTLPNSSQETAKISQYFTLRDLAFVGSTSASLNRSNKNLLSQDIIYNLTNLAVNCLDPIKAQYGNMQITSGWRAKVPGSVGSSSNHPNGYAADIIAGGSSYDLAQWIATNLKGRFTMLLLESRGNSRWCHVQLGSIGSNQGSLAKPLIATYVNDKQYANKLVLVG
jgi:hypothetical protein